MELLLSIRSGGMTAIQRQANLSAFNARHASFLRGSIRPTIRRVGRNETAAPGNDQWQANKGEGGAEKKPE
jgi:hypothetical protein